MSYSHGYWELTPFLTSIFSFFPRISTYIVGDIPDNVDVPPVDAKVHYGDGFCVSNSVEIMNDSEPYEMARALDFDDDRPVGELTESDVEMMYLSRPP